jgi:hypothetical protein
MREPLLRTSQHRNLSVAPNTRAGRRKRDKKNGRKETKGEEA